MVIQEGIEVYDEENNKYKVISTLGAGGFGYVYKILSLESNKYYALKTLPSSFHDEVQFRGLVNEGLKAKDINNNNIINYLYFHDGNSYTHLPPYIIMELAHDGSLQDLIEAYKKENKFLENSTLQ